MNKKRIWRNVCLIIVLALFLSLTANPWKFSLLKTDLPLITPLWNWMQQSTIKLGLDLQGGTQLDYEIDLSDARARNSDDDPGNDVNIPALLSGVKDVIDKRVNSLGVAEPNIYLSSAGDEEHIVVELPGVKDIQEAKNRVGKVVQLEFKTEKPNPTPEDITAIELKANDLLKKIKTEKEISDLESFLEDSLIPGQVEIKKQEKAYLDELPKEFQNVVKTLPLNTFSDLIRAKENEYIVNAGQVQQPEGFSILRITEQSTELRKKPLNAEDFDTVAKASGGQISDDYLHENDFPSKKLLSEVRALENGEITGVIETEEGFYSAKMKNKNEEDESENAEPQIRTAHILLKTESLEDLKSEKLLKDILSSASEEEKIKLEEENKNIAKENADIKEENKNIEKRNQEKKVKNEKIKAKAASVLAELKKNPQRFSDLAKKYSEDSSKEKGGDLGYSAPSSYVKPYSEAALKLEKGAFTQELVESQFGYHIIKLLDTKKPDEEIYQVSWIKSASKEEAEKLLKRVREEPVYTIERVWLNAAPDPWAKTELDGRYFKRADVEYDPNTLRPYVAIQFNDEGGKIFEQLTEANVQKRLGIFVGGEFISAPVVQQKISGGNAQITLGDTNVQIALKEANELASSLNAGTIPAPLKKPNELNIGASLGAEALQKSLYAGALGLVLVSVFMMLYYRYLGFLSILALSVYGLFLLFVIQSELNPLLASVITLTLWIAFVLRLLRSSIDNLGKMVFLLFSILGVAFVYYVLVTPIVMTLAGVAGLILSVGMAVDANILIFERMKEEFAHGKSFLSSVHDGFERAWSSILDSNVSSLITCAILFTFGTSVIKGFAINLAVGIVISMFTAITVTQTFILLNEGTKLEKLNWLWKRNRTEEKTLI